MLNDIILLENETLIGGIRVPYKITMATQIVITSGSLKCRVDFRTYSLHAPAMAIFLRGQVIESFEADEEFSGFGIMMRVMAENSFNVGAEISRGEAANYLKDLAQF